MCLRMALPHPTLQEGTLYLKPLQVAGHIQLLCPLAIKTGEAIKGREAELARFDVAFPFGV